MPLRGAPIVASVRPAARTRWVVSLVVAASAAWTGSLAGVATGADVVLDRQPRNTRVDAFGGTVAWSAYNARSKRYALVIKRRNRQVRRLPIASRRVAFDVDVGPGRAGRPRFVYSRCRREGGSPNPALGSDYERGRDCAVYLYDFGAARERRVPGTRSRHAVFDPTVWRSRIVYASSTSERTTIRALELGARGARGRRVLKGGAGPPWASGVGKLDLRGTRVAISWGSIFETCPGSTMSDRAGANYGSILVDDVVSGRQRLVEEGCGTRGPSVTVAGFATGTRLVYRRVAYDGQVPASTFRSFDLGSTALTDVAAPVDGMFASLSPDGSTLYAVYNVKTETSPRFEIRRLG